MAVHLMTTTGSENDVRTALGLSADAGQATTPTGEPFRASVEQLPSAVTPPAAPPEPAPAAEAPPEEAPAAPADADEADDETTPQARGAQTKGRLQKRIDELVAARYHTQGELEEARRQIAELKAQLNPAAPAPPVTPPAAPTDDAPKESDFDTYDQYLAAVATHAAEKAAKKVFADQQAKTEVDTRRATLRDRVTAFAADHPDYAEVISNPALPPLPPWVIDRLTDPRNDLGPAMGYALSKDPARLTALVAMDPPDALEALGVLKAELRGAAKPATPLPKLPAAPPPPTQVRGSAVVATQTLDDLAKGITPGDPRTSEWIARRNAELAKRGSR